MNEKRELETCPNCGAQESMEPEDLTFIERIGGTMQCLECGHLFKECEGCSKLKAELASYERLYEADSKYIMKADAKFQEVEKAYIDEVKDNVRLKAENERLKTEGTTARSFRRKVEINRLREALGRIARGEVFSENCKESACGTYRAIAGEVLEEALQGGEDE